MERFAPTISLARLVAKRDAQLPVLNARLTRMADVLERVTKEIKSLP